ncbi:NAD-dependent epimerase/dehydratase family protein [Burkholderiaceae bacterium DAT-1]|nr:NAD-dependent epimerase/dehydratase family protein [Burkholderiaceae bacterium DAT-1]
MNSLILITGGAGFIGSHTVDALLQRGLSVRVLDDLSTGKRENLPDHPALEFMQGDIRNSVDVARAMKGVSRVLHLAAQVSVQASIDQPATSAERNIAGFINVLDAARHACVARFVYASSAAVYGQPVHLPLNEASEPNPASPYGLEKLINDQYAHLFSQLYGVKCLGMRYFNVYGPRQDPRSPYAGVLSIFKDRILADKPLTVFGDGEQTRDFIYVGDIAEANCRALLTDGEGVVNVGTGTRITLNQVIAELGLSTGKAIKVDYQTAREGDIVHSATENIELINMLGAFKYVSLGDGLKRLLAD